jgi:predicted permease
MQHAPTFFQIFFALLPLFGVASMGAWFRQKEVMDASADATILWLVIHVFTPALIIDSVVGKPALEDIQILVAAPFLGYATVLIGVWLSKIGARFAKFNTEEQLRTFVTCVSLYNYGYVAIPVIIMFFNHDVLGMLFLFNTGVEFAMWTIGVLGLTGKVSLKESCKRLLTPPVAALFFSVMVNAYFVENPFPVSWARVIHMLGQATIPMALLLVGATIFDHGPIVRQIKPLRPIIVGSVLRLFIIPATFVLLSIILPIPVSLKTVLCVQAGMPSAVLPIIFVRKYGGDLQLAIRIITATSIFCLFTMPLWLSIAFAVAS